MTWQEAYLYLDDMLADWDAILIAHHRERVEWHSERLRELGAER